MNARTIKTIFSQAPFEPLRIILSSGDRYDLHHPENLMILKEAVGIALRPGSERPLQLAFCSYLHIAAVEPLHPTDD